MNASEYLKTVEEVQTARRGLHCLYLEAPAMVVADLTLLVETAFLALAEPQGLERVGLQRRHVVAPKGKWQMCYPADEAFFVGSSDYETREVFARKEAA